MIEVLNINPINKGSLLATCDVHILPWKMTIHEIKIFQKGENRWIALPTSEFVNKAGEVKYKEHLSFDNDAVKNRFRNQIMGAIDKFISENPDLKPEDVIKLDDECPF